MISFGIISIIVTTTMAMTMTAVTALDPLESVGEGSCSRVADVTPVRAKREFIDSLQHITAGNKYHLYRAASAHANYSSMLQDEFYYEACFTRNTTTTVQNSTAAIRGFGRLLSTSIVTSRSGLYFEAYPPGQPTNTVRATITLTDHKNFAVWVNCWAQADQIGWGLVTTNGKIDKGIRQVVETHVKGLGFKRENFVFLRYDSCQK